MGTPFNRERTDMKSKLTGLLVGAALAMGITPSASAAEQWAEGYLMHVYPEADGSFIVTFQGTQPAACTNTANPKYFEVRAGQFGVNADGVKAMLATALTAHAAGKWVQLAFDDSTSNCYINRLRIVS
jgi:hypothetical protein